MSQTQNLNDAGDWRPTVSPERLRQRAELLSSIRCFFRKIGVTEVETPICSVAATPDPALDSLVTRYTGPGASGGKRLYLHTSPEFFMKRLLAAGSGAIYQICKVFRDGEIGRYHNPEFTLLEWYQPGYDLQQLMDEVEALVLGVLETKPSVRRLSYADLFQRHLGIDPHGAPQTMLQQLAVDRGVPGASTLTLPDTDAWLDLLLTHCIAPCLGDGLWFVYDYPASQASLARIRPGEPAVAERFELYLDGLELANGFNELTASAEQRHRFGQDLERRRQEGRSQPVLDERFLAALSSGLPDCAGVALGIDRLLMRMSGARHINEVLAFPFERA